MNRHITRLLLVGLALGPVYPASPADRGQDEVELTLQETQPAGLFANRTGENRRRALAKYGGIFVLPVKSPTLADLGRLTQDRMNYNAASVRASFVPDLRTITITASDSSVVPITGLCSDSSEVYGRQCISHVSIAGGQSVTRMIQ